MINSGAERALGLKGLEGLDGKAQKPDQSKRAAKMLEGVFIRQLFAIMRRTVPDSGLMGGGMGKAAYTEMLDGAFADQIAEAGGLGLGSTLASQLGGAGASAPIAMAPSPMSPARGGLEPTSSLAALGTLQPRGAAGHAAQASRALKRAALDGIAFAPPRRPESVQLEDRDGKLTWPVIGASGAGFVNQRNEISAAPNATVRAAGSGKVVTSEPGLLVIDHGGTRSVYRGLGKVEAQVDDLVLRGQAVGALDANGQLVFGVERGGRALQHHEMTSLFTAGGSR